MVYAIIVCCKGLFFSFFPLFLSPKSNQMIKLIRQKVWFFIPFLFVFVLSAFFILISTKAELHLWLNKFHTSFFDSFFKIATYLGDGVVVIIIGLLALVLSFRLSAFIIAAYAVTGIFTQLLKHLFFSNVLRPAAYFKDTATLYLIEGVRLYHHNSFPSGHAASAFALFLCIALSTNKKIIHFLCFLLASITAYSRVYLSQHFLIDVLAGAIIGIAGTVGFYYVFYGKERNWHKLSLLTLWRK